MSGPMRRASWRTVSTRARALGLTAAASAVAMTALADSGLLAAETGISGKLLYNNNCRTCHSRDAGDNRLGPHLADIVGRQAGAADGYAYSSALDAADFKWTKEKLDAFIADPNSVVPGNNMKPYGGMPNADERAILIDYLAKPG